jgi:predicted DNA-binding transcriptional regulator AlpA
MAPSSALALAPDAGPCLRDFINQNRPVLTLMGAAEVAKQVKGKGGALCPDRESGRVFAAPCTMRRIAITTWPSRNRGSGSARAPSRRVARRRPLRGFGLDRALDAATHGSYVMAAHFDRPTPEDDGMNGQPPRALTEREVATRLGLSVATLRAWRMRRNGPRFVRLGRAVRYLDSEIDRYIQVNVVSLERDRTSQPSLWDEEHAE